MNQDLSVLEHRNLFDCKTHCHRETLAAESLKGWRQATLEHATNEPVGTQPIPIHIERQGALWAKLLVTPCGHLCERASEKPFSERASCK